MSLLAAVKARDVQGVRQRLAEGADPNELGEGGRTPLIEAAEAGSAELCKLLLDGGADPSLPDGMQETPLLKAAAHGHRACVSLLWPLASEDERATASAFLGSQGGMRAPEPGPASRWEPLVRDVAAAGAAVSSFFGDEDPQRRLGRLQRAEKKKR